MKCVHPTLISKGKSAYYVPCGRCAWCRRRMQDDWFFRLSFESRLWPYVFFVTLTYSDDFIPTMAVDQDGVIRYFRGFDFIRGTDVLVKNIPYLPDVQKYIKRLRKRNSSYPVHQKFYQKPSGQFYLKKSFPDLKYICVAEYGTKRKRPHYHLIIFCSSPIDAAADWHYCDKNENDVVQTIAEPGSFRYVTKYLLKGSDNVDSRSMICSNGLGANYINFDQVRSKFYEGEDVYLPRYVRDKLVKLLDDEFLEYDISKNLVPIDSKHCRSVLDSKASQFDDLYFSNMHNSMLSDYIKAYGSEDGFDKWLRDIYEIDYLKQIKINGKSKL